MRSIIWLVVGTVLGAGSVSAQVSPEGQAYHMYITCVEAGAAKYAVLDQPLSDIAAAAAASCAVEFMAFNKVLSEHVNINQRPAMVEHALTTARSTAIRIAADAKLSVAD